MTQAAPAPDRPGGRFGDATVGNALAFASAIGYAGVNALMRAVAGEVDPLASSLLRQVPLLATVLVLVLVLRPASLDRRHPAFMGSKWMLLPAIGGTLALFAGNTLLFLGLGWVGLGIATAAITGGNLLTGALTSWLVLKERPTGAQLAGLALMLTGLVATALSAQAAPVELALALLGFAFSVAAGSCYAMSSAVNRAAQRTSGRFIPVLGFMTLGGVVAIAIAMLLGKGPAGAVAAFAAIEPGHLWTLLGAGVVNGIALGCYTLSVRFTTVTAATMLNSLMIVFGVLFGWMFFRETASGMLLAGCALILGGVVLGQLRRRRGEAPAAAEAAADEPDSGPHDGDGRP